MLPRLMCTTLILALYCVAAGEQKDFDRGRTPERELHIKLIIVPAVFPPHHKDRDHNPDRDEAVTYNLLPVGEEFSVSKEMRSMMVGGMGQEQVQVTTVVLK